MLARGGKFVEQKYVRVDEVAGKVAGEYMSKGNFSELLGNPAPW